MAGRLEHALTHSDQPSRENVMGGKRSQVLSPEAAEYIVSWAEMTTGIADYARWQQMFEGRLGKDDPPFRRGASGRNECAAPKPEKVRRVFDDASSAWVHRRVFPRPGPGPSPGGAGLGRRIPGRDGEVSTTGGPTGAETVSGGSYAMGSPAAWPTTW